MLPLSIAAAVIVAEPFTKATVIFLQIAAGGVVSTTVTKALQIEKLPEASVTVRVIVCGPSLVQSKEVGAIVRVAIPQLSVLPPSTSAATMVTEPIPRATVILLHTATGRVLSAMVTVAEQEDELPAESVTVRVTVLVPRLLQPKEP